MQGDALHLVGSLANEDGIEVAIVAGDFLQGMDVASIDELTDAAGIVHRLVLQRRETVVKHIVGNVQVGILQLGTTQLVVGHLDIRLLKALTTETVVEAMAVIQHVIGGDNHHEQYQQQDHGNALVDVRLLHGSAIVGKGIVGRQLLEQLRIYLIIICIERPFVQRQGCHGTLVTDVENNLVVGLQALMQPLYLGRQRRVLCAAGHQQAPLGMLLLIVGIEALAAGVGKEQGAAIGAVDVAEECRVGIDMGLG